MACFPANPTFRGWVICAASSPELAGLFEDVLLQLETDPHAPKLRLHRLKGTQHDQHSVSLTYSYCIVLIHRITVAEIILLDVGSHDEVYRG